MTPSLFAALLLVSYPFAGAQDRNNRSPHQTRPNLLVIMTDQQRFDALSFAKQNKVLHTPNIDRIGYEGVWFKNAYTSAPVCGPARTSFFTGQTIENTRVRENNMPGRPDLKSYDDYLVKNEGYVAELYGKWHSPNFMSKIYQNIIDVQSFNLFRPWRNFLQAHGYSIPPDVPPGMVIESMNQQPYTPNPIDERYASRSIPSRGVCECDQYGTTSVSPRHTHTAFEGGRTIFALRRLANGTKPFSLHVSFNSPHGPHTAPKPYASIYNAANMPIPTTIGDQLIDSNYERREKSRYGDPSLVGHMIAVYYAQVKEVDAWVGAILREMDKLGLTNNTMVVFTADHGEMLGSHGMIEKSVLYEEAARIPLLMRFPNGIKPNTRVGVPVSHRDVFATILDYLGARPRPSDGTSLRSAIEGKPNDPPFTVVENGQRNEIMIRAGSFKLIIPIFADSADFNVMYNLKTDPEERHNLIGPSSPRREESLAMARFIKSILVQWCIDVRHPNVEEIRARRL